MAVDENGVLIPSETGAEVAQETGVAYTEPPAPNLDADGNPVVASATTGSTDAVDGALVGPYDNYGSEDAKNDMAANAVVTGGDSVITDKSTVASQLTSLLDSESPYLKQAKLAGEKQAASRGMLNSSMAAGASQAQAIQAALPIAQQDAQSFTQANLQKQAAIDTQNQTQTEGIVSGEMNKQNAAIAERAQGIQNTFTALQQTASEEHQVFLQGMQEDHGKFMQNLEQVFQQGMQTEQISAQKADSIRTQSSAIMQNYQISVENMMTDPDFLELGADAVNNGINQMQQLARNSIMFLGASSNIDLDTFVDTYLDDLTVYGDVAEDATV